MTVAEGTAMYPSQLQDPPHHVVFLMVPQFSMACFASTIEPLRQANRISDQELFTWELVSMDGEPIMASNNILINVDSKVHDMRAGESLFICTGLDVQKYTDKALLNWVRRQDRMGVNLGGVSTGCYILAKAGLLDGYRCTIHWENLESFREEFPDITVSPTLFEIDRSRFTCAGGTAAIDMMVTLVALAVDRDLAQTVAEEFIHAPIRDQSEHQRVSLPARIGARHPKLVNIVETMENNLEEPLSPTELAQMVKISTRQLERLFRRYLNRSPKRYYLELRLQKARQLLLQTNMSVIEVALACGFTSPSHFSKCYRAFFDRTPYRERGLPGPHLSKAVEMQEEQSSS